MRRENPSDITPVFDITVLYRTLSLLSPPNILDAIGAVLVLLLMIRFYVLASNQTYSESPSNDI
jgi:hypothetical protein